MSINVIVLASGPDTHRSGSSSPMVLSEFQDTTLLEKLCLQIQSINPSTVTFLFSNRDSSFKLSQIVQLLIPECKAAYISPNTEGSACSALFAAVQLPMQSELLILCANEYLDIDYNHYLSVFRASDCHSGVFCFDSILPIFSFVKLDPQNRVIYSAQRDPISRYATTGSFWFKSTDVFVHVIQESIRKNDRVEGLFYIAPALNQLLLLGKYISAQFIQKTSYHPLKSAQSASDLLNSIHETLLNL